MVCAVQVLYVEPQSLLELQSSGEPQSSVEPQGYEPQGYVKRHSF